MIFDFICDRTIVVVAALVTEVKLAMFDFIAVEPGGILKKSAS